MVLWLILGIMMISFAMIILTVAIKMPKKVLGD